MLDKSASLELVIGKKYIAKHTSGKIIVTLTNIRKIEGFPGGRRASVRYECRNEKTGRGVTFKSKGRFLKEVEG